MELEYSKCISNIMNYEKETPVLTSPPQNYSYSSPGQTSADKSRNKELPASVASSNAIPDSGDTSRKSHNKNLSISQKKRSLATLIKPLSTHAHFYAQSDAEIPSVREDTVPSAGKAGHSPSKGGHAELPEIDEDGVILLDAYRAIRVLLR